MNKNDSNSSPLKGVPSEKPIEEQAKDQTGKLQIRVRLDEKNLKTSYANGFRPTATAEEIILDFGLNTLSLTPQQKGIPEIIFQANDRIILNYYVGKRLAMALSQIIRQYEQEFGELELNAGKRRLSKSK